MRRQCSHWPQPMIEIDDHPVALLHLGDLAAGIHHLAHELMADDVARLHRRHVAAEQVQVGAADRGHRHPHDGVMRVDDLRVRHGFDPKVVDAVPDDGAHGVLPSQLDATAGASARRRAGVGTSPVSSTCFRRRRSLAPACPALAGEPRQRGAERSAGRLMSSGSGPRCRARRGPGGIPCGRRCAPRRRVRTPRRCVRRPVLGDPAVPLDCAEAGTRATQCESWPSSRGSTRSTWRMYFGMFAGSRKKR